MRGNKISMVFQEPGSALDPLYTIGYQIVEALRTHTGDGKRMGSKDARRGPSSC